MIVADASVVLKWVLPDEADREEALVLRDRHFSNEALIAAPELLFYEIANVLPVRWGEPETAERLFNEIYDADIERYSFTVSLFVSSMELAHRFRISTYDASYVALAQTLRCRFITTDEHLLSRLKGVPHIRHLREFVDE